MKTLLSVSDLRKADILKILDYSTKFEKNELESYVFAKHKILGLFFLQESLRTSASLKSAILKLGGGWIDFDLSYVKKGEENLEDSIIAVAPLIDVMAIRGSVDVDIRPITKKIKIPIINAMIGMEHSISAIWKVYVIQKRLGKINNLNIGMYGFTGYSPSVLAIYKAFSKLGAKFKEDSVIEEAGAQRGIVEEIEKNGGKFERAKLDDFIEKVDCLFISEGLPVEGADKKIMDTFNKSFKPLNNEMVDKLRQNALFCYIMPRVLTDGRMTVEKEVDRDPRLITYEMMEKSVYVNMGILAWLFE